MGIEILPSFVFHNGRRNENMEKLKIDVLCNDGSPLGVSESSIHGSDGRMGVGGAELAILTLMGAWHDAGHEVTFYNNPQPHSRSRFRHSPISLFIPKEDRDILIIFRSPNRRAIHANAKKKVWLSTDQYTVGNFAEFALHVDQIVTISNFHADYFQGTYGIQNTTIIDLPVRVDEYKKEIDKVPNRMIYCSVPTRGLDMLAQCYPHIQKEVPDASLVITSDFRLWGAFAPMNEQYIRQFMGMHNVVFLGAVSRAQLIDEQLRAEIHGYPCTYDELFCYSSAECQVAGAFPISSTTGALETTNMGLLIPGDPKSKAWQTIFIETVVRAMKNREQFQQMARENQSRAISRFATEKILAEWDKRVLYG